MICKFCQNDRKLVKSHIIPKSLYKPLFSGGEVPEIITNKRDEHKRRSPKGVYDKTIVCSECERKFDKYDNYASSFFLEEKYEKKEFSNVTGLQALQIDNFNYGLLKLFGLSLLWRASVSTQPLFKRVSIGVHEKRVKEMIEQGDPGSEQEYSIILAKFDTTELSTVIMDPYQTRHMGVNFYRFYFNSYCMEIKVDKRRTPTPIDYVQISPNRPLFISSRKFAESKELKIMKTIISHNEQERI
ncbi:hypothetical protein D0S45_08435 [Marinifilum sp. JC120]|nr:hypothetical protein D0S45_08435 [Marinifilum sp. JC120]